MKNKFMISLYVAWGSYRNVVNNKKNNNENSNSNHLEIHGSDSLHESINGISKINEAG